MLCSVTSPLVYTSMVSAQYLQMQTFPKSQLYYMYIDKQLELKAEGCHPAKLEDAQPGCLKYEAELK